MEPANTLSVSSIAITRHPFDSSQIYHARDRRTSPDDVNPPSIAEAMRRRN
jgi:hypothetical protein